MAGENILTEIEDEIELLDESALNDLSKDAVVKYTLNLTKVFSKLNDVIKQQKQQISEMQIIKNVNSLLSKNTKRLEERVSNLERNQINNSQYIRNRQIEIRPLPKEITSLKADDLLTKMTEFLSMTGADVTNADIDKCHPLGGKKKTSVIMEFRSRTLRDDLLLKRKNLKMKKEKLVKMKFDKVSISESLCREYATLDYVCRKLKLKKIINDTWFFNGKLFIKNISEAFKTQITHISDLYIFGEEIVNDILDN